MFDHVGQGWTMFLIAATSDEGWRIGWITVHDADGAFADAGVPETLLKLCQARGQLLGT